MTSASSYGHVLDLLLLLVVVTATITVTIAVMLHGATLALQCGHPVLAQSPLGSKLSGAPWLKALLAQSPQGLTALDLGT